MLMLSIDARMHEEAKGVMLSKLRGYVPCTNNNYLGINYKELLRQQKKPWLKCLLQLWEQKVDQNYVTTD